MLPKWCDNLDQARDGVYMLIRFRIPCAQPPIAPRRAGDPLKSEKRPKPLFARERCAALSR
jgi:hypothetical protein